MILSCINAAKLTECTLDGEDCKVIRFLLWPSVLDLIVRHSLSVVKTLLLLLTDPSAAVISDNVTESVATINGRERIKLKFKWQVCHIQFDSLLITCQAWISILNLHEYILILTICMILIKLLPHVGI